MKTLALLCAKTVRTMRNALGLNKLFYSGCAAPPAG
jgi:hypothetical protein